ncbi:helix-turn-helix domain-containing protein [Algicola sagamiensis]|uniref:helix-turn-helix domain-containing protein n=1 Tax=Algicola sagamiensis TaxID=163869 RepID=UPI00039D5D28|nr:helix-turn-helix transcriptional regulator [Algicola sagamiensis]
MNTKTRDKDRKNSLEYQGQILREARRDSGLTQEELAEILDCSVRHIQNIEAGKCDPSFSLVRHWMQVTKDWRSFFSFLQKPIMPLFNRRYVHEQRTENSKN